MNGAAPDRVRIRAVPSARHAARAGGSVACMDQPRPDRAALLARSDGPVTRDRLVGDLRALGLTEGDTVMFHTRMSALGYVVGGPRPWSARCARPWGSGGP